jgi:4-amino-4-deoxy-L-arabinose transferase-like glycosyltransferase
MTLRQRIQVVLLLLLGAIVIISTTTQLSYTPDELPHVHAGMEWWQKGTYTFEPMHTPLTRIVQAAPNYWLLSKNLAQIFSMNHLELRMVMPRVANVIFFLICGGLVFYWSRALFGYNAGFASLLFYVTTPIVLGHTGLATTDMGYTAMFLLALLATNAWLDNPSVRQSVNAGIAVALMLGAKLSGLVHWPAAVLLILAAKADMRRRRRVSAFPLSVEHFRSAILYIVPVFFIALVLLYKGDIAKFFVGIGDGITKNKYGHALWLFGPLNNQGVWYFFPVVFFFKVQLAFLISAIYGIMKILPDIRNDKKTLDSLIPAFAAFAVLLVSTTSNINLGVRHVLPMFPLLAIPAGYGLYCLWKSKKILPRICAVFLGVWQLTGVLHTYPEHIAYFNELAGAKPERISYDSDFDWGHSLLLLDKRAAELGISDMYVCIRTFSAGTYNLARMVKFKSRKCPPGQELNGWVAVSRAFMVSHSEDFTWLQKYEPYDNIGRTMLLYYIAPEQTQQGN